MTFLKTKSDIFHTSKFATPKTTSAENFKREGLTTFFVTHEIRSTIPNPSRFRRHSERHDYHLDARRYDKNMRKRLVKVLALAIRPIPQLSDSWNIVSGIIIFIIGPQAVASLIPATSTRARFEIALLAALIAILAAAYRIQKALDDTLTGLPKLVCKRVTHRPSPIIRRSVDTTSSPVTVRQEIVGMPVFYHLNIANEPTGMSDRRTAEKVAGRVQIFHEAGEPAANERLHRWADSPGPGDPGAGKQADRLLPLDIPPSGVEYKFDIAMKYDDDDAFYTPNNETVLAGSLDWREDDFKFPPGNYVANVRLQGPNVVTLMRFRIVNKGSGSRLLITPLAH